MERKSLFLLELGDDSPDVMKGIQFLLLVGKARDLVFEIGVVQVQSERGHNGSEITFADDDAVAIVGPLPGLNLVSCADQAKEVFKIVLNTSPNMIFPGGLLDDTVESVLSCEPHARYFIR